MSSLGLVIVVNYNLGQDILLGKINGFASRPLVRFAVLRIMRTRLPGFGGFRVC